MDSKCIVIGNSTIANYLQGGGHWIIRIQYLLGLKALGHQVILMALLWSTSHREQDQKRIHAFMDRMKKYGLSEDCLLILFKKGSQEQNIEDAEVFGKTKEELKQIIDRADIFINDCCMVRQPLLGQFRHRALLDLDPGHLQVSAKDSEFDILDHHVFLTVGLKMGDQDCKVPLLGVDWKPFTPFVYLPLWEQCMEYSSNGMFTSITHWNWGELWTEGKVLSLSKRDAYMRYCNLPEKAKGKFQLATDFGEGDKTDDKERLLSGGWSFASAWEVAKSPESYQKYVASSMAEISCPKPIFRELKTGWISDRSVCYLASGRPVLAEDTGFSDKLPMGEGLLAFSNMDEAIAGYKEICENYEKHSEKARELAEENFSSETVLRKMIQDCS